MTALQRSGHTCARWTIFDALRFSKIGAFPPGEISPFAQGDAAVTLSRSQRVVVLEPKIFQFLAGTVTEPGSLAVSAAPAPGDVAENPPFQFGRTHRIETET
ncbi:hypothetical protein [Nocardia sp. R6R-6]|uniref:hypothetical protein n=1 Tax=Nocardia sp. R6R-6 TaxID=3459303 RepID=UPI00403D810D